MSFILGFSVLILTFSLIGAQPPQLPMPQPQMRFPGLANITTMEEFARLVKTPDGQPLSFNVVDDDRQSVSGVDGGATLAALDACSPHAVTFPIDADPDPSVFYWPPCTTVVRCGGCCPSPMLSCEPTDIRIQQYAVMKTRIPFVGSTDFVYVGMQLKQVEQHFACEAQCKVKATDCSEDQVYFQPECRCKCINNNRNCPSGQYWDEERCKCVCSVYTQCSGFSVFSTATCRCELRQGVSSDLNNQDLAQLSNSNAVSSNQQPSLPPLLTVNPCLGLNCPAGNGPRRLSNGRCQCLPILALPPLRLPQLRRKREEMRLRRAARWRRGHH